MNTQLQTFNFKSNIVRAELIENEPYFCLKDVCSVLSIVVASPERFNLDSKGVTQYVIPTNGGRQELTFINEPNLYRIIFKSRKAEAIEFQNWVFDEVLPQIRKTGKYERTQTTVDDRTGLRDAVNMLVSKKGLIYSDAYQLIHQRFNVNHIDELTKEQLPQAVEYAHKIILEGELIIPEKQEYISIGLNTAQALVKFHRLAVAKAQKAETALRQIHQIMGYEPYVRNDLAAGLFDIHHEFTVWLNDFEQAVTAATMPKLGYVK